MDIAEQLTNAIRLVSFAQRDMMMQWVEGSGLTHQQAFTLGYIDEHKAGGVIAKDLAAMSRTTPASVASLLQGLEERGLIIRTPSPTDSRVKLITPTDEGTRIVAGFDEEMLAAQRQHYSSLSDEEQRHLLALLERLVPEKYRDVSGPPNPRR